MKDVSSQIISKVYNQIHHKTWLQSRLYIYIDNKALEKIESKLYIIFYLQIFNLSIINERTF